MEFEVLSLNLSKLPFLLVIPILESIIMIEFCNYIYETDLIMYFIFYVCNINTKRNISINIL